MFRQLVANLPYSPALVSQLGFYARRLKREQVTRQLGLIFTILALVVQSFAVIRPPESANAAGYRDCSTNSIIDCGTLSISELQQKFRQNVTHDLPEIYAFYHISSQMINSGQVKLGEARKNGDVYVGSTKVATGNQSLGRQNLSGSHPVRIASKTYYESPSQTVFAGDSITSFIFFDSSGQFVGGIMLACSNPLRATPVPKPVPKPSPTAACNLLTIARIDRTHFALSSEATTANGATISAHNFVVKNSQGKIVYAPSIKTTARTAKTPTFSLDTPGNYIASVAIVTSVGDKISPACQKALLVAPPQMCALNPTIPNGPDCLPCAGDSSIWYKDENCIPNVSHNKTVTNLTQHTDGTKTTANPGDHLQYTLTVKNTGKASATQTVRDQIGDILQYSTLQDAGGGTLDSTGSILAFNNLNVAPNATATHTFTVEVASTIPSTPQGTADPMSYDCKLSNTFGDTVSTPVTCPPVKTVESVVQELPSTGPGENILFGTVLLMVVTYFFARSRQMSKEVRLIRHDFNTGTL